MQDLFHEEESVLSDYLAKIDDDDIYVEDAKEFADHYQDLIDQGKIITRISDRLQKKLDLAYQKIKKQNQVISLKNDQLENKIHELNNAKVGKKATRTLMFIAIGLFVSEEYLLEPIIDSFVNIPYLEIISKACIAFSLKFFESGIENFYMKQEKENIIKSRSVNTSSQVSLSDHF